MYTLKCEEKRSTREAFGEELARLGEENKDIMALAAGCSDSTKVNIFAKKFPERYVEAGIAEANMVGMAAGLALAGKVPFVSSFAVFVPGRCYDHIRQSVCYSNLNVKLVGTHFGITVGPDGATHQMLEDIAMMRTLPNMTVLHPADGLEAEKATRAAAEMKGPCYLRLSRNKVPTFTNKDTPFEIGKAVQLRDGSDLTLIATGPLVYKGLKAAEALEKEGISARVLNMHTIKPLDEEAIVDVARDTGAIVTIEEHQMAAGLGGAVAEVVSQRHPVPMRIVGMPDTFGESGNPDKLLEKYGFTEESIALAARVVLEMKGRDA